MTGTPLVVLDACVLANFSLCDTLLRLAEPPRLFEPKWSEEIIRETTRTLEGKLGWPNSLTAHFEKELRFHFKELPANLRTSSEPGTPGSATPDRSSS